MQKDLKIKKLILLHLLVRVVFKSTRFIYLKKRFRQKGHFTLLTCLKKYINKIQ